ncbi:MAG: UvrD-helicase domain-containing protein, partial [Candidatus Kapaibacterium sp.]
MSILLLPGFSDEQREALRLDRHIVVRAAAGSGKTFVLVERYVRMLSRGVHPRAIVAITFTRKAAAEMLSRIRERIEQLLQSPQLLTPEECSHLQRARKNISSARVSTIHSFCSGILREYAVEAGLSPDFSELNSADRYGMYAEAIDAVVQSWWNSPAHHDQVRNLFFELGSGMAMKFLGSITRDYHKLEQLRELYQRPDDELPSIVSRMYQESLFEEHLSMVQQLQYAIDGSAADPLKPEVAEWLSELAESVANFLSLHNEDRTHTFAHTALSILVALPQPSFTAVALKSNKAAKQAFEIYKSIVKSVDGISADPYKADIRMIAHARTLTRMAVDVAAEADMRKNEAGALDFDDLQRYTLQLLENDAVRRAVCRGIEYIMMDEFQDTDDVQYTLLKKLVPELDGSADRSSINVFLVGDVKQSIYGFRNADVRVFARAEQDVLALNSREYNEPGVGSVHLPASYRMAPQVAAVVNSVCTQAFGTHQSEYDVPYEPLVCARDPNTLAPGRFEFVLGTNFSSKARAEGNKNIEQSALVADAISHALSSGVQVYDKSSASFRQASYRDIAVLCRSAKPLEQLEAELLRAQIPFIRHAGRGFYSTQEVRDAISFLTFLVDHSNNQALIALLRSPMFAVSDDTIYAYQTSAGSYSLWEHLLHCRHSAVTHISDARLSKAVDLLLTFGREALMRPASESVREILLQTGWDAAVGYQEHRTEQSRRNMDKLGTVLRDIE